MIHKPLRTRKFSPRHQLIMAHPIDLEIDSKKRLTRIKANEPADIAVNGAKCGDSKIDGGRFLRAPLHVGRTFSLSKLKLPRARKKK